MLSLYRRHLKSCPNTLRSHKKCGCPIWAQGTLHGKWMKKTLDLRNWEAAQKLVRDWEGGATQTAMTVEEACAAFIRDCEARKLSLASMGKYKHLTEELKREFKNRSVGSIEIQDLRAYRERWELSPVSARKKLERLRTFFKFCHESAWTRGNPAKALKPPVAKPLPTLPFSDEEIEKIFWAVDLFPNRGVHGANTRARVKAFVNLLRYSGLRIRDATTLSKDKVQKGKLLLYTQKTGTPVWLPLPKSVVEELQQIDEGGRYYFWTGNGSEKSGVSVWQRTLSKLFENAGVVNGHAHRFRDTFSVNLLQAGVPLETVSILLGHSSVKITEKHYSPWVKSRQVKLEESIEKAWKLSG
jgi:integrase/recombinase XerD